MKALSGVKKETIVAIDIETVRIVDNYEDLSDYYKVAWAYKCKQDKEIPSEEELAILWKGKESAVNAEFAKICAVSLTMLVMDGNEGEFLKCAEIYGENEHEILTKLSQVLNKYSHKRLVGHAAKFFDYPFMCKRFIINGIQIPFMLDTTATKPWDMPHLCTHELWKMGGLGPSSSLVALCAALDVPISKGDLDGSRVDECYYAGEYDKIGRYCSLDTIATFNIFCKFKGLPIYDPETNVNFVTI